MITRSIKSMQRVNGSRFCWIQSFALVITISILMRVLKYRSALSTDMYFVLQVRIAQWFKSAIMNPINIYLTLQLYHF